MKYFSIISSLLFALTSCGHLTANATVMGAVRNAARNTVIQRAQPGINRALMDMRTAKRAADEIYKASNKSIYSFADKAKGRSSAYLITTYGKGNLRKVWYAPLVGVFNAQSENVDFDEIMSSEGPNIVCDADILCDVNKYDGMFYNGPKIETYATHLDPEDRDEIYRNNIDDRLIQILYASDEYDTNSRWGIEYDYPKERHERTGVYMTIGDGYGGGVTFQVSKYSARKALGQIIPYYSVWLVQYIKKITGLADSESEDLAQDVWLSVLSESNTSYSMNEWEAHYSDNGSEGEKIYIAADGLFHYRLARVARNVIYKRTNKFRNREYLHEAYQFHESLNEDARLMDAGSSADYEMLIKCIYGVDVEGHEREIAIDVLLNGMPLREIETLTGVPRSTAHRIVNKVRGVIIDSCF